MSPNEQKPAGDLRTGGFRQTYVWQDGPNVFYAEHVHNEETAHIILSGAMTLIIGGDVMTCNAGQRYDVPAGASHSARMGPQGCRYLIGER
jgi:mannose-6-phosphate isomerase-like protein (cupin superfamily)